jgi:hypothetical protein
VVSPSSFHAELLSREKALSGLIGSSQSSVTLYRQAKKMVVSQNWEGEAPAEPGTQARQEPRPPELGHDSNYRKEGADMGSAFHGSGSGLVSRWRPRRRSVEGVRSHAGAWERGCDRFGQRKLDRQVEVRFHRRIARRAPRAQCNELSARDIRGYVGLRGLRLGAAQCSARKNGIRLREFQPFQPARMLENKHFLTDDSRPETSKRLIRTPFFRAEQFEWRVRSGECKGVRGVLGCRRPAPSAGRLVRKKGDPLGTVSHIVG